MIRAADLTITKNETGGLVIYARVKDYFLTRHYYYYTKKEAARLFLDEVNNRKENTK